MIIFETYEHDLILEHYVMSTKRELQLRVKVKDVLAIAYDKPYAYAGNMHNVATLYIAHGHVLKISDHISELEKLNQYCVR